MSTAINSPTATARSSAERLKLVRKLHLYFGVFISPALLFFAFTGAVQTLSLHEAAGSSYKPPAALAVWGQIHKKQTWMLPARRPAARDGHEPGQAHPDVPPKSPEAGTAAASGISGSGQPLHAHQGDGKTNVAAATPGNSAAFPSPSAQPPQTLWSKQKQHLPLKLFFLMVSLGLFTSTFTGIYMAYKYDRNKLLITGLLIAGAVLPLVLLPF